MVKKTSSLKKFMHSDDFYLDHIVEGSDESIQILGVEKHKNTIILYVKPKRKLKNFPIRVYEVVGYEEPPDEDMPRLKLFQERFISGSALQKVVLDVPEDYLIKIGHRTVTITPHDTYINGVKGRTHIYRYDAGTDTFSEDLYSNTGWDFFTDDAEAGDMIYFGNWYHPGQFEELQFHIDVPRNGNVDYVWEYFSEDGVWKKIPNVVDETDCFSKTGVRRVYWDMDDIPDWYYTKVANSQTQCWFVRCRLVSVSGLTEGGHQQSGYYLQFPKRYLVGVGGTTTNPLMLKDFYDYDIANKLLLLNETISSSPETFTPHTMIRPPKKPTKLIIEATARTGATVTITGLDEKGNTISETVDISSGSATTSRYFSWINQDGIVVTGLNSGDYIKIYQPRLGIIEYVPPNLYILHGGIVVGDGATSTYFKEYNKQIYASRHMVVSERVLYSQVNAILQLGLVVDETDKSTQQGCDIHFNYYYPRFKANYLYSSTITQGKGYTLSGQPYHKGNFRVFPMERIWNCFFKGGAFITYSGLSDPSKSDLYNVFLFLRNLDNVNSGSIDNIFIFHALQVLYLWRDEYVSNLSNVWARVTTRAGYMGTSEPITKDSYWDNCDIKKIDGTNGWLFYWVKSGSTGKVYRRHSLFIRVVDIGGNPIQNALIKIYDKDGNLVYSGYTDSNGEIPEQLLVYAYYTSNGGASGYGVEIKLSPYTIVASKSGYMQEETVVDIDRKLYTTITLKPLVLTTDQEVIA